MSKIIWNDKITQKKKRFRILSIDGGGAKGYFTAYALKRLKKDYGINIIEDIDLVVGTSTGSIIASSLLYGVSTTEIFNDYNDENNPNFVKKRLIDQISAPLFAQYDSKPIKKNLDLIYGDITLPQLYKQTKKSFAFTATNFNEAYPVIFGSPNLKFLDKRYSEYKLSDAIYSSSAAPMYLDPYVERFTNDWIIDGGLWSNNPVVLAIVLAVNDLGIDLNNIEILSFGQTFVEGLDFKPSIKLRTMTDFRNSNISHLYTATLVSQMNFVDFVAKNLLKERYYRYAPDKDIPRATVAKINDDFKKHAKEYFDNRKESLLKFLKDGINTDFIN